jgi:hypothetical protein
MATSGLPLWSTTAASNGTADPAVNFAEGMAPSAVNDSSRALMASVAKWRDDLYGITTGLSTGGTATAYTVTTNSTYATAAVMSGAIFSIVPHTTSGAAPTLAVDGLTARALNFSTGVAIPTGAMIASTPYFVRYVHATTEFIVIGPSISPNTVLDIIGGPSLTTIATDDTIPIYDLSATANRRILVSDVLKVINLLTADATPDGAADYVMTYDTSASAAKKVLLANLPSNLPRGYIDGCILSNGTDATNDINITAGKCRDSTDAVDIVVSANTSGKQLDANWAAAATTNSGMRNSAAGIANGTYHIYAARTAASSAATIYAYAGVAGTDPDSAAAIATMLTALQAESGGTDYIYARRIGSIVRESAAVAGFVQIGDEFLRTTPVLSSSTAPTTTVALYALNVPLGLKVKADFNAFISRAGSSARVYVSSPDVIAVDPSTSAAPGVNLADADSGNTSQAGAAFSVWTNRSGEVRIEAEANISSAIVVTTGWTDRRGKDA